jgi:hypothetical protein
MSTKPTIPTPPPAPLSQQQQEVADFIAEMKMLAPAASAGGERGRLVFAMDATMSREPTWDMALRLQGTCSAQLRRLGASTCSSSFSGGSMIVVPPRGSRIPMRLRA